MNNAFEHITQSIVAAIEARPTAPDLPWHRAGLGIPWNAVTSRPYRGINVLSLWVAAQRGGYPGGPWASYRQWLSLGAQVRKGEKGTPIVFYATREPADGTAADPDHHPIRVARAYHVFNAAQVDGWTPPPPPPALPDTARLAQAEAFFGSIGAAVVHAGEHAFYRPATDTIHMPPFATFKSALGYYAVLAHEHVHWTGASQRLDRGLDAPRNALTYAGEELIAELGAAFLCAALSLATEPRPDHAGYIASWLTLLRDDPRAIAHAAALASRAIEYLQVRAEEGRCRRSPDRTAA